MNIVKEFEDQEFFCLPALSSPEYHGLYTWYWGLSDDGDLYYRCTRFSEPDRWFELSKHDDIAGCISLKTMKKLVGQFEHLLVFL
jgi:hypothetical protein